MKFWIGIGIIGLLSLALVVDSARVYLTKLQIADVESAYVFGPDNADLTVIEFVDYSCATCRALEPFLSQAIERDGKVRLIPKPLFAKGHKEGEAAAFLAYAAGRQGKFKEAHRELLKNYRVVDETYITAFAENLELDAAQLRADLKDPQIAKIINKNRSQLVALKSGYTPTLLIGAHLLYPISNPVPSTDALLTLFAQGRKH
jgi:protein-disulfide isomerase